MAVKYDAILGQLRETDGDFVEDAQHRTVTDDQIDSWDAKQDALIPDVDYLTPETAAETYLSGDHDHDGTYAPLESPTFSGTVTVPYPSNVTDAATKGYADSASGNYLEMTWLSFDNLPADNLADWNTLLVSSGFGFDSYEEITYTFEGTPVLATRFYGGSGISLNASCLLNYDDLLSFKDYGGVIVQIGDASFMLSDSLGTIIIPDVTTIGTAAFNQVTFLSYLDISSCTSLGATTGNNIVFDSISGQTITVKANIALKTNNSGDMDGDLAYLAANNTVTFDWVDSYVKQYVFDEHDHSGTYLEEETDPVVGAVNGIVKGNGTGTISAATADTDYATPALAKQTAIDLLMFGFMYPSETNLSFDGTDTITLAAKSTSWSYYRNGIKYTITGNKSIPCATPMVDGTLYYIYIDSTNGTLVSGSAWTLDDTKVPVCTLYWDNTLTPKYVLCDERHTTRWLRGMHREHHFADGTETRSPGVIAGLTAGSDTITDKVFSITGASIFDEDLYFEMTDLTKPDGNTNVYPILYRTAANTYKWLFSDMPFKYTDTAGANPYGFIEYDSSGTSTASAANRFVNTYLVYCNSVSNNETDNEISTASTRFFIMQGRGSYSSSAAALSEKFAVSGGLPFAEAIAVYQFTWATTNRPDTVKGRCRYLSTQSVNSNVTIPAIAFSYDHNSLLGLDGGTAGEYYHLTSAQHTVATAITGKASSAELNTGTEDTKYITPDGLAGSNAGTRVCTLQALSDTQALAIANGKAYFRIPSALNGMNLISCAAQVYTKSSSGNPTIMITRGRQANATSDFTYAAMLSVGITIDANEYDSKDATTAYTIDASNDDVATGDVIRIDITGAGTGAKGLSVSLSFQLP